MLDLDALEKTVADDRQRYASARPFPHLIVDGACDTADLQQGLAAIRRRIGGRMETSGDLIFAKNKYVDAAFDRIDPALQSLRDDLLCPRFARWLSDLTGMSLFVDPNFYGGGLHVGGKGSYLDMHTDFNFHPKHPSWHRELNLLLYLNEGWERAFGGALLLQNAASGVAATEVEPLFNRLVVMETSGRTLHGYDPIAFPTGQSRLSIAAYAYRLDEHSEVPARSTVWYPRSGGAKRAVGKLVPNAIAAMRKLRRW